MCILFSYRNHVQLTSLRYRDQQNQPLATAIYWVEYVARHHGAPQLHSSARLLGFWAVNNLDVYAMFAGLLAFIALLVKILFQIISYQFQIRTKEKEKRKIN